MHEDQVLRMALACIRWNQFGECRTDGWPGLPPTAADTAEALELSLAKPQPVGGALTDEVILSEAREWGLHGGDASEVIGFARDMLKRATLSAPVAQPGEAVSEPEPRCDMCHFKHGHRTGCPNNPAADLCTPKMLHPSHISGEWVDANGQYYALAAPAQAAAVPEAVDRDAARYRWLRSTTNAFTNDAGQRINVKLDPEAWDAAIDAALGLAAPEAGAGGGTTSGGRDQ